MADFNQELIQAFQNLNQSVNGMVLQKSLNAANEQVNQIRTSDLKEEEKRGQLRGLANDLTMRLTGMGMDPNAINQATQAIAPKPAFANAEQALMYGDAGEQKQAQKIIQDQRDFEMQKIDKAAGAKSVAGSGKVLQDFQKRFANTYQKVDSSGRAVKNAIKTLQSGSKLTGAAVANALVRAAGDVGNITESERAPFSGAQDVLSQMQRIAEKYSDSTIPPSDRQELMKLARIYESTIDDSLKTYGNMYANQLSEHSSFSGLDKGVLMRKVTGGILGNEDLRAPDQASGNTSSTQGNSKKSPLGDSNPWFDPTYLQSGTPKKK